MCESVDNDDLVGADWYAANFPNKLDPDNDIGLDDVDDEDTEDDEPGSDNDDCYDPMDDEDLYNGWWPGVVDDQENLQRFRVRLDERRGLFADQPVAW